MKNNITLTAAFFLLLSLFEAQAQTPSETVSDVLKMHDKPAAPGTYQFVVSTDEYVEPFTNDILLTIERYREEKQEAFLALSPAINVRIPSRSEIESTTFIPLEEVVYINQKPAQKKRK